MGREHGIAGVQAFEATLDGWMGEFHALLVYPGDPSLAESDPEREGVVDRAKAAVCECLILFLERNEEEFAQYLGTFVQDVWEQLMRVTQAQGQVWGWLCSFGRGGCTTRVERTADSFLGSTAPHLQFFSIDAESAMHLAAC